MFFVNIINTRNYLGGFMRKFLLSLLILFSFISVDASVGGSASNIKIENIEVEAKENIGYNEELTISYSINPRDAKNLNLVWDVIGIKKGVTVEFVTGKNTSVSDGEVVLKVNNALDTSVTLTLRAKQNGKILSSTKLIVETKEETINRIATEVNDLILGLDEKVNKYTYEDNLEKIEKIDKLLEGNQDVEDAIDSKLLKKYETVKKSVNEFDDSSDKTFVIVVSVILVIIFSLLIIWIFKKED